MHGGADKGPDGYSSLRRGRITYFPVAPGRMEFAAALRAALLAAHPAVVAVELPGWLESAYRKAAARLPEITAIVYPDPLNEERGVYVVVEPADPFTEAVRTALEIDAALLFLEPDHAERPHLPDQYPDTYALRRVSLDAYIGAYRVHPQPATEEVREHAAAMAWRLQGADPTAEIWAVVSLNLLDALLEAMEQPQEQPPAPRRNFEHDLLNPHPECLAEITQEYPFQLERYERYRAVLAPADFIDRLKTQWELLRTARANYELATGDKIEAWQRRLLARYTRNLALIDSQLAAGLYDITLAARSIVDDNYGWDVWETGGQYAWQRTESGLETVNLSGEEVFLRTRRIRLRRRLPRMKQRLAPRHLKRRPKERRQGEWAEQVNGDSICSYPPEDIVIEDYGKALKQRAKSLVSEERGRVEPFLSSLLDGVDLRETIRNWHERKIYVRRFERLAGDVGAVVVIFDEDRQNRYSYLTTWQGEHQNESDMAYYSTQPFEHMVGPGIGRAEYGGLLMTLPPRRMYDVWGDPDYEFAETKAERLLLAALDYSQERHVVYVAAKPPRSIFRSIAAHLRRSILFVPIGQLSPSKLKQIRVVHVLDSHARRETAGQYLW